MTQMEFGLIRRKTKSSYVGQILPEASCHCPKMEKRIPGVESDQVTSTSESGPWAFIHPLQSTVGLTKGHEGAQGSYSPGKKVLTLMLEARTAVTLAMCLAHQLL